MLQPSTIFEERIRAYQLHALYYGKCSLCRRGLAQGDKIYVGKLADGNMAVACELCKKQLTHEIEHYVYHPKEYKIPIRNALLWRYQDLLEEVKKKEEKNNR